MKHWLAGWTLALAMSLAGAVEDTSLALSPAMVTKAVAVVGEPVDVAVTLRNTTGRTLVNVGVSLNLPESWSASPARVELPALSPYTTQTLRFTATANAPDHAIASISAAYNGMLGDKRVVWLAVSVNPLPLVASWEQLAKQPVGEIPEDGTIYVSTGSYIVFLPRCGEAYGPGLVYLRNGSDWRRVGTIPALGHLIYRDLDPVSKQIIGVERWVFAKRKWINPSAPKGEDVVFKDQWQDNKGRWWTAKAYFAATPDPRVIKCTHMVWCTDAAAVWRYEGPMVSAGDGTFGARGAKLPPEVPSPVGETATVAVRQTPTERGYMAVETPVGGTLGFMWDPHQEWTRGQTYPQALFVSPNRLHQQDNSLMALLLPIFGRAQPLDDPRANAPIELPKGRFLYLRSELFVLAGSKIGDVAGVYAERFGTGGPGLAFKPDPDVKSGRPDR